LSGVPDFVASTLLIDYSAYNIRTYPPYLGAVWSIHDVRGASCHGDRGQLLAVYLFDVLVSLFIGVLPPRNVWGCCM